MIVVTLNLHSALFFSDANIVTRLMAGCTTGAMAVAFAQPTDVVKVRFQAQVRQSDGLKRYNGTMDAYRTIARDEGIRGLWRGEREFLKRDSSSSQKTIILYSNSFHSKPVWLYFFLFFVLLFLSTKCRPKSLRSKPVLLLLTIPTIKLFIH